MHATQPTKKVRTGIDKQRVAALIRERRGDSVLREFEQDSPFDRSQISQFERGMLPTKLPTLIRLFKWLDEDITLYLN